MEEAGEPLNLGKGVAAGFESLVRQCKARGDKIFKSKGRTSKHPTIQLGKSSRSAATRRSKLSSSLTSEIIDDELELAQLQADAEVEEMERQAGIDRARDKAKVFKKQAQIQAKLRK